MFVYLWIHFELDFFLLIFQIGHFFHVTIANFPAKIRWQKKFSHENKNCLMANSIFSYKKSARSMKNPYHEKISWNHEKLISVQKKSFLSPSIQKYSFFNIKLTSHHEKPLSIVKDLFPLWKISSYHENLPHIMKNLLQIIQKSFSIREFPLFPTECFLRIIQLHWNSKQHTHFLPACSLLNSI